MAKESAKIVVILLLLFAGLAGLAAILVCSGVYNVGADVPHSRIVHGVLEQVRSRSVANHARNISVPRDLNDPRRISAGAGLYGGMCTGCHLGPGVERSEMSQGLYPPAPELARGDALSPAEQFWTIKHGVKLTGMPAWGKTHSDELIWDIVAFVRTLPALSSAQYKALVAAAPEDHEQMMKAMEHDPGGNDRDDSRSRARHS